MIEKSIFKDGANKNLTHPQYQRITNYQLIIVINMIIYL